MSFHDRAEAGRRLAKALMRYKDMGAVVLALPRGGAPVAAVIATALHAPLDLVLVRKIGVPFQPELAMGAIADGGKTIIVRNEDVIAATGVSEAEFNAVCDRESREIERRRGLYLGGRERPEVSRTRGDRGRRWDRHRSDDPRGAAGRPRAWPEKACPRGSGRADRDARAPCATRPTRLFAWRLMRCSGLSDIFTRIFARSATRK